ncbi:FadR family transcriptional regulator [Nocardia asteroides NBRC 15531]|uniref:FadR/GntR family transcriptional regulator n=1 Tax=Nocardia asteroides TaxID=1824 RepID=UPI0002F9D7E4|nr:GntR family transcriptional regulator [Nocardia asteroides]TLF68956.1 FadR family transcriptional regulator [Nocardia asteroides NBRC 15531]UGT48424.1 GntR family transcriptional regulator [Nocardia asteroides]SFL59280.1 transcriptional regulator, GntR family [Nocardia asteroides]VEG32292.1 Pyruvate dehydrogenase complex repressor [Nocardia asteroides]
MAWTPVVKRSVSGDVFEQIANEVLGGELAAGSTLPSERQLAEALGVSRPAVREALQRLAAAGLVSVRQGEATTVLDYRRSAGLEVLPRLLLRGDTIDPAVARSILEARLHNGPKIAELAAARVRRSSTEVDDVLHLLHESVDSLVAESDPLTQQRIALEFWDHVLDLADSIAFRLMFSMLRAAYEPALAALAPIMSAEVGNGDAYRDLAAAIAAGEPDRAAESARALLGPATTALIHALDGA